MSISLFETITCLTGVLILSGMVFLASAIRIVPEDKRLKIYRLGRYLGEKGPGIVILLPAVDRGVMVGVGDVLEQAEAAWGAVGETLTSVHAEGSVQIEGKTWDAVSDYPIAAGRKVRVKKVILEVEELLAA